ncbi:Nucleolar protein 10 [Nymphaea thermarum]|nr:Nucleolar protein 10 [Nymphaea thermarum]
MGSHGGLKVSSVNGVKIYSVSGQRSIATWLAPKKLKALRKDKDYRRRLELIQDLRFETATTKIKATPDGEYLIASGVYPPQVKVYELRELSLKFERHLISEIVNFQVLAEDYSKLAFLCSDRSVCLHAKYGSHYSLRIPRMGRDMAYDRWSCDLLCVASSPDLYRINLEQGRFVSPLSTQSPSINVVRQSMIHGLVACGGEDGYVECFDLRAKSSIGRINAASAAGDVDEEITALQFDDIGGLQMAILIYDLRQSCPLHVKDHMYGTPILDIKWHQTLNTGRPKMITTDKQIVRIWDPESGDVMAGIEPTAGTINDVCAFGESGLLLLALEGSQIPAYFIPALGPAPKWCSYLEHLTEELEESEETTIYDNYKFLTREDIDRLKLTNLIGTDLLRAYMHGFFIDYRVYQKALTLADPFAYDSYRKQRIQEKMEKERAARITIKRKLPKVNKVLAARLLENAEANEGQVNATDADAKKSKKKKGLGDELLKDERFASLFEDKDFEIDEHSFEYLALHPNSSKQQPSSIEEHFDPVLDDDEEGNMSDSEASSLNSSENEVEDDDGSRRRAARAPRLYEVKDARHAEAFWSGTSLSKEEALSMEERVAALENQAQNEAATVKKGPGGSREMSFIAKSRGKRDPEDDEPEEKRRGTESLGLKPDSEEFHHRHKRGGKNWSRGRSKTRGRGRGRGRGRR